MYFIKSKIFKFGAKKAGFTVIELLAVIGIMTLISIFMLSGRRSGEDQRKLNIDSQKLVQNLRKAQNYAMSAKESECTGNPVMPYGINLNSNSPSNYLFIADCNNSKIYDSGDFLVSTIPLGDSTISSISPSSGGSLNIFFEAPIPKTYINGDTISGTTGEITLCSKRQASLCKSININLMGTIGTE